jgi:hypothetical protein
MCLKSHDTMLFVVESFSKMRVYYYPDNTLESYPQLEHNQRLSRTDNCITTQFMR